VTRRENSGSPCGESWTAQGSKIAHLDVTCQVVPTARSHGSSVKCRLVECVVPPAAAIAFTAVAERVGLTLSPARTWARWSSWTPTPTLVAAQKDEARTTFKGGHGFHSSGLWCVTTPTSWARSIL
jgi:lipoprotein-anchoring transpeptidase ErfK/SrfK